MKPRTLNRIRSLSITISMIFSILLFMDDSGYLKNHPLDSFVYLGLWILINLVLLSSLLYHRDSISASLKRLSLYIASVSLSAYLILQYIFPKLLENNFINLIFTIFAFTFLFFGFILFFSFLDKLEIILIGLTFAIPSGYIISRLGLVEGDSIVIISFLLSSVSFIVLLIRMLVVKDDNKIVKIIFAVSFGSLAILDILMLLKSSSMRPAFNSTTDLTSVILFLAICLFIFMTLPFSNYIEWIFKHKNMFKRLIVFPLIIFMLIFSLKFILPGNTYRKIFFREFSDKNVVYFNMKNYEVNFRKSGK